jgi:hypothetical protein
MKSNTAIKTRDYLEKSKSILKEVLDKKTLDFISKNKNVLLY